MSSVFLLQMHNCWQYLYSWLVRWVGQKKRSLTKEATSKGCIFTVIFGLISDHLNCRGPIIAVSATVTLIGYIVLYTQTRPGVAYVGAVLATGTSVATPPLLAWMTGNTSGDLKRAVVVAMAVGAGTLGGYVELSPRLFMVNIGAGYAPLSYTWVRQDTY
jgi:hypothetical protein